MGGEQPESEFGRYKNDGSSPRGRGTVVELERFFHVIRFIPAWAGNRNPPKCSLAFVAVHPRVGGEQANHHRRRETLIGSSPRGRGTDVSNAGDLEINRFIPAWAGNSAA